MKMWVAVSSPAVGNIIKKEELQIDAYLEQLVAMFNAIVSRDSQSPHGKFYFVAKRLQERFTQIKEGTTRPGTGETERGSREQSHDTPRRKTHQSPANQTPLHLLSEVAMGSSNAASSQQQGHTRSQQQAQAALQAAQQVQQPMQQQQQQHQQQQNWYPGIEMTGMPQTNFDINFDFTQFDLGTGSDADLSALFIPDAAVWNYATPSDPNMQGYTGF